MRKSVQYKGVEVVYSQRGVGEVVLLLHGFLEERSMWNQFTDELSKTYNVIAVDLLGQGETGNLGYVHSMEDHAAAVAAVLDAEKVERFTVIGHSMGGYVALAEILPAKTQKLVLFHSTASPDSEERKKDRERVIELVKRNKSVYVRTVIPSLFAEHSRTGLQSEIQGIIDTANGFTEQGIVANIRGMMERKNRSAILKNADFPKLILHGELDSVISSESVEDLAALNPNISLQVVSNIGHMGHLEAPEKCLQIISDFIAS